ncbi:MAG: hypothetical protein PHQ05_01905 [Sterolibacterium sp.]|nr:hypothetical protein [Sterolibacterium sp.]
MLWIEGIGREGSAYGATVIDENGNREWRPVSALHDIALTAPGVRRKRITTCFSTWMAGPAEPFFEALDFKVRPENMQAVFQVEADNQVFLIPASVLMAALFRPFRKISPYLFRPQGLDDLCFPMKDSEGPPVAFFRSASSMLGSQKERTPALLQPLSWMHCFPSARRMWDSVILAAREGQLGILLPKATVSMVMRVLPFSNYELVTDITITVLDAEDDPYAFAENHARTIVFHQNAFHAGHGRAKPPIKADVPSRNGIWAMSEKEWGLVRDVVVKKASSRHSPKTVIDCILEKFGRGISWGDAPAGGTNTSILTATHRQMLKDGRWPKLLGLLQELRAPTMEMS